MNAPTMPAINSSRRSTAILTAALLLVLSLSVTVAAAQQYAPPPQQYAPPPPQQYAPPPQQQYARPPQEQYAPPPPQQYAPPPQQQYAPPPQQQYAPPPQQQYAPPPPQQYAPPPQQQYAPQQQQYTAPQQQYAPAQQQYAPQQQQYAPQQQQYTAPQQQYAPAQQQYAPQQQQYAPQQQQYAPQQQYSAPRAYAPSAPYSAPPTFAAPAAFAASAAFPASAASPGSPGVHAAPSSDEVSDFVTRITQSTRFDRASVARWRGPICLSVEGLPESENAFVVQRLSQIATAAGAHVLSDGCGKGAYNFRVLFTLHADQDAKDMYRHHRDLFEENAANAAQIDRFVDPSTPGPVRVWHNATLFGTDGQPLGQVDPGDPIEALPHLEYTGSRLVSPGVIGLNFAAIIVDGTKTNSAGLAPLTDYIAMVGLADLDLGAELGGDPTILRLFTAPENARPAGLTAWDRAFLTALYRTDEMPKNLRAELATTVAHDVSAEPL